MAFKIVGADENSDFPARVEAKLASKFASPAYVDTAEANAISTSNAYTDDAISGISVPTISEDPTDPGFFI